VAAKLISHKIRIGQKRVCCGCIFKVKSLHKNVEKHHAHLRREWESTSITQYFAVKKAKETRGEM
jgi:hypothetical protein